MAYSIVFFNNVSTYASTNYLVIWRHNLITHYVVVNIYYVAYSQSKFERAFLTLIGRDGWKTEFAYKVFRLLTPFSERK